MSEVKTSEVLYEAARILMTEGWGQGTEGWMEPGTRCSRGAIDASVSLSLGCIGDSDLANSALARWLIRNESARPGHCPGDTIVRWNDAPERTAEDVILALKQCAAGLEERGE